MRNTRLLLVVQFLFSITVLCQNTQDAVPKDVQSLTDGFYCNNQQGWEKLQPISMSGGGLKHAGKMFVPGLTPQMVWTYRGAEAPFQISGRRPNFLVKEMPAMANIAGRSERDLVIVRFDEKKDHRDCKPQTAATCLRSKRDSAKIGRPTSP
jgi:hypothetical protein